MRFSSRQPPPSVLGPDGRRFDPTLRDSVLSKLEIVDYSVRDVLNSSQIRDEILQIQLESTATELEMKTGRASGKIHFAHTADELNAVLEAPGAEVLILRSLTTQRAEMVAIYHLDGFEVAEEDRELLHMARSLRDARGRIFFPADTQLGVLHVLVSRPSLGELLAPSGLRRSDVAKEMLNFHMVCEADEKIPFGPRAIIATCREDNAAALAFYLRNGWRDLSAETGVFKQGEIAYPGSVPIPTRWHIIALELDSPTVSRNTTTLPRIPFIDRDGPILDTNDTRWRAARISRHRPLND